MINAKLWSAALIAVTALATPALAAASDVAPRHVRAETHMRPAPSERYVERSGCIPAPRVGAFATEPWTNAPPCEPNTAF